MTGQTRSDDNKIIAVNKANNCLRIIKLPYFIKYSKNGSVPSDDSNLLLSILYYTSKGSLYAIYC